MELCLCMKHQLLCWLQRETQKPKNVDKVMMKGHSWLHDLIKVTWLSCIDPDLCMSWHHGVTYFTSFHRVCNVSACPDSTPIHTYTSLQHSCGDGPTLNNFHSGLADRQQPLLTAAQQGTVRKEKVWEEQCVKMRVDIWAALMVSFTHVATWIYTMSVWSSR